MNDFKERPLYEPKKLKLTNNREFFRLKKSTPYDVSANSRIWGCKTLKSNSIC